MRLIWQHLRVIQSAERPAVFGRLQAERAFCHRWECVPSMVFCVGEIGKIGSGSLSRQVVGG